MSCPLPIGVVMPTFNSMALLPSHLDSAASWLERVEEVVVVDSNSNDGTFELLQQRLRHPRVRFFSRPRGLYQSWNYGIQQLRSTYTYISTIGDSISADGLAHLCDVAQLDRCDVVVSPPVFVFDDGPPDSPRLWPINRICRMLNLKQPRFFHGMAVYLLALKYEPEAILGSSASNLYRTAFLHQRPFPTEYGTTGDCAWAIQHAFEMRLGITPEEISNFRIHEKSYAPSDYAVADLRERIFKLAVGVLHERIAQDDLVRKQSDCLHLQEVLDGLQNVHASWQQLQDYRQRRLPWYCNPSAWRTRCIRERSRAQLNVCIQHLSYCDSTDPLLTDIVRSFLS